MNNKRIFLPIFNSNFSVFSCDEIVFIKAKGAYSKIYNNISKDVQIALSLKQFNDSFSDCGFFRCHRSYIINLNYVTKFNIRKGVVGLNNNIEIPLAVSCREQFVIQLNKISKIEYESKIM